MREGEYDEFKRALVSSDCRKCGLAAGRTQLVVDRGNPNAKVVLIGEAPGKNEDLQGKAFVGRAGRLLDAMMLEAGFDTNAESLIINVVKCRPPDNRKPLPEEADACRPFLKKQLELVKPAIILLLGATALKHILPAKEVISISERVGKFFEHPDYPNVRLMVLFHPAYILRDPRKRPLMAGHIRTFKDAYDQNR